MSIPPQPASQPPPSMAKRPYSWCRVRRNDHTGVNDAASMATRPYSWCWAGRNDHTGVNDAASMVKRPYKWCWAGRNDHTGVNDAASMVKRPYKWCWKERNDHTAPARARASASWAASSISSPSAPVNGPSPSPPSSPPTPSPPAPARVLVTQGLLRCLEGAGVWGRRTAPARRAPTRRTAPPNARATAHSLCVRPRVFKVAFRITGLTGPTCRRLSLFVVC